MNCDTNSHPSAGGGAEQNVERSAFVGKPERHTPRFTCVFLEHNPNRQFGGKFKCAEPRKLRDLRFDRFYSMVLASTTYIVG